MHIEKSRAPALTAKRSHWGRGFTLDLMMLPGVIILLIYAYIPMLGIIMAFQKYLPTTGFLRSKWVGMENFIYLFKTPGFGRALYNTVSISGMKLALGMFVPVLYALLLNEIRSSAYKRTVQTIVYLPYFISWVLLAGIFVDILSPTSGIVNQLLNALGMESIYFLGDEKWFPYVMVITDIWKGFGWGTIIFMAALTGIDPGLYEAALIDGANRWKQTLHVTLPGILPTIILVATLNLGSILNAGFDQIFNFISPITMSTGDIIDTLVYRLGIESGQFSLATAAGLFKSVVSCLLIVTSYALADRFAGYKII